MDGFSLAFLAACCPERTILILFAFCLDLLLGDPRWLPHPVVFTGKIITLLEKMLRKCFKSARGERLAGTLLTGFVVSAVFFFSREIIFQFSACQTFLGWLVSLYLLYTSFSLRSLEEHILAIERPLKKGDLPAARRALSFIVGRDTEFLAEEGISRATLESLAESTGDGVIAPLFYAFLGGPPLVLAYKAINTLDSMLGYRNKKYFYFGWAAARLDDLANLIPARLAAFFFLIAALTGGRLSSLQVWEYYVNILREGRKHLSPNSGYPEAAAAILLGVRLGGRSNYGGVPSERPLINAPGRCPSSKDLEPLRILVKRVALLALLAGVVLHVFAGYLVSTFFL